MPTSVKLPFGKHLPDQPSFENPGTPYLKNVVPSRGHLRPFSDIEAYSDALGARAQGAVSGRDASGNVYTFMGDVDTLYKLSGQSVNDVSRTSGGAYATPAEGRWEFIPWSDDILIAINGTDDPQKIDPQTGANFTALGGSPPAATTGAVVRSFVMLGNWASNENVVRWSAIDDAEGWANGTNQAGEQFLPSGGAVMRILGGEVGIVFAQESIHRFTYVGSPIVFQRDEIGPGVGLLAPGAAAQFGNLIFFVGKNSFYKMDARGEPEPIGESRWNKTFFGELDENAADKITSAIDPINTIWIVTYASTASGTGLPDRAFLYNWATDDCSFVDINTEFIFSAYSPGISLDNLTTQTGDDLDTLQFSLDSRVWQGGALVLSAFDRDHKLSFFSGSNLEAEIDTVERDGDGRRLFISGVRPLVDASDAQVSIRYREGQSDNVTGSPFTSIGPDGLCPQYISTRYARARLKMPAGSSWSKAQGVEAYIEADGEI